MNIVRSLMTPNVLSLSPGDTLHDAYEVMKSCHISHVPVVDNRKVVGMVSQGDVLLHAEYKNDCIELKSKHLRDVMSRCVVTCLPSTTIANVAATMICCRIESVPVTDVDGNLIGIITTTDLLDYLCSLEEDAGHSVMPFDFVERDHKERITAS